MGADTKALRTRIKSVDSTLHLTKAMGLVASSKIRGASDAMNKSRQYSSAVRSVVELLLSSR
ncbi:MAG: F0F1 ATP synthase subunit gamma, partial [Clostridia bacterium]|nr:F0F1 ATP synthase subunit gamma [Clostridia bacterium]